MRIHKWRENTTPKILNSTALKATTIRPEDNITRKPWLCLSSSGKTKNSNSDFGNLRKQPPPLNDNRTSVNARKPNAAYLKTQLSDEAHAWLSRVRRFFSNSATRSGAFSNRFLVEPLAVYQLDLKNFLQKYAEKKNDETWSWSTTVYHKCHSHENSCAKCQTDTIVPHYMLTRRQPTDMYNEKII